MSDATGKTAAEAFMQEKRDELRKARLRVERLEDALRHYEEMYNIMNGAPLRDTSGVSRERTARTGSQGERVRQVLADAGVPVHIDKIMARLGMENTMPAKNSLAGSLSRYVRQGQIFTRPERGTFGLIEWGDESAEKTESDATTRLLPTDLGTESARQSVGVEDQNLL